MDLSDFQRKAVLLIFLSILAGSVLLSRKEPLRFTGYSAEQEKTYRPEATEPYPPSAIDINTADIPTLTLLPGIGPSLAREIAKHRPFETKSDLLKVPGIGEKRLARIEDFINLPDETEPVADTKDEKGRINLNTASSEQLCQIPGIGPKRAQSIIDHRDNIGEFVRLEQIKDIAGIGDKTYGRMENYLYIETQQQDANAADEGKNVYDSHIDPNVKCPFCETQMWIEGRRKQRYVRCPHCLELLD